MRLGINGSGLVQRASIDAIVETAGRQMYRQIRPWLVSMAGDLHQPMKTPEKIANHLRAGATIVNMGWKITTAVVQPLGYLQTVELLGNKYSTIGLKKFYGAGGLRSMRKALNFVLDRSEQVRNRMTTFDRDVREAMKKLDQKGLLNDARRSLFFLTGLLDMSVTVPTWMGAYAKSMDGNVDGLEAGNEYVAIDYADSIVRRSQSAGGAKDLAGVQQSNNPLLRLIRLERVAGGDLFQITGVPA